MWKLFWKQKPLIWILLQMLLSIPFKQFLKFFIKAHFIWLISLCTTRNITKPEVYKKGVRKQAMTWIMLKRVLEIKWIASCILKSILHNILKGSVNVYIYSFHVGGPYHIETSPVICRANKWTSFYLIGTSVMFCFCFVKIIWCEKEVILVRITI